MGEWWDSVQRELLHIADRLVGVVVILVVGMLALRYLIGPLRRMLARTRLEPTVASFLLNSVRTLFLVAILLAILQQLGVQTTSLLTLLGAAGLAVALSLQGSLANFASGLIVLAFRMVRLGDQIEVGDVRGRVCELLPFHVVVETADNQLITLPNSMLTGGAVRNNSVLTTRRVQWSLPVSAKQDLSAAKEALRTRLLADGRVLKEPGPVAFVQEWADDKRVLTVQAWASTAEAPAVQQELLEELGRSLGATARE